MDSTCSKPYTGYRGTIPFLMEPVDDDSSALKGFITISKTGIEIAFEGYGEMTAPKGFGYPLYIENLGGKPRAIAWGNINSEEPTDIISFEGAAESLRKQTDEDDEYLSNNPIIPAILPDPESDGETDFILTPGHDSAWIAIEPPEGVEGGSFSIHIKRGDDGPIVDLYRRGGEFDDAIASTWASWGEALWDDEESEPWTLIMESDEFGSESFDHDSKEEAIAAYNRLFAGCFQHFPKVTRNFTLFHPNGPADRLAPYKPSWKLVIRTEEFGDLPDYEIETIEYDSEEAAFDGVAQQLRDSKADKSTRHTFTLIDPHGEETIVGSSQRAA